MKHVTHALTHIVICTICRITNIYEDMKMNLTKKVPDRSKTMTEVKM